MTNRVKKFLKDEAGEGIDIAKRFKKRDFSGNSGKVIKNSFWQIATNIVAKGGSLLFTIILARLMLPELYGLYGLALSTILFFGIFSDLGLGSGMSVFVTKLIDKEPGKAKGYFYYFMKYKAALVFLSSLLIIALASFLANDYYNKPIFYALIAGAIYLPINTITGFIGPIFNLKNDFKPQFIKEIVVQILRLTILPLAIVYLLKKMPTESYLFWVFLILSFCYLVGLLYICWLTKLRHPFEKAKPLQLQEKDKHDAMRFVLPLGVTAFSGIFLGYIDQIMLGHYVSATFLGFYQAAFNLIHSATALIGFGAIAVFPILARLKGKRLENGFIKVRRITLLISLAAFVFTILVAKYLILFIYGAEYLTAYYYLIPFSILLISFPIITLYQTYYISQKKSKLVSILLIGSTLLNILFNFIFINLGLYFGPALGISIGLSTLSDTMFWGVMGACIATILSRYLFMLGLIIGRKKTYPRTNNIKTDSRIYKTPTGTRRSET